MRFLLILLKPAPAKGRRIWLLALIAAVWVAVLGTLSPAIAQQTSPNDELFLSIREAAQKQRTDLVDKLAGQLPSQYPLHAFAEYWKLKVRQPDVSDATIKAFISKYDGQFVADRLRNDWLLMLGKRGDWKTFDEQHPLFALADDPQVDCYAFVSKAAQGLTVRGEARGVLLRNPAHLAGEGCLALVEALYKSRQFQNADVWDAIQVLAEGKRTRAALQLASLLPTSASGLEQAINNPSKTLQQRQADKPLHQLALAAQARGGYWGNDAVTAHTAVQGASSCAQRLGNDCNSWFKPGGQSIVLPDSLDGLGSDNALEWSLRGALRARDWALVDQLSQRLPPHLKVDPTWTYWHARALEVLKQPEAAMSMMERLSKGYGFYHLLAREALGLGLPTVGSTEEQFDEATVKGMMQKDEILRMQTFYKLGLRWEGNREWNWMVRGANDKQLLNYAEAGRRLGLLDRMINTAERSKQAIDFKQRYPMPFITRAQPIADGLNLDTNWVYGLMRQESRFITDVRSSVSARGLMQVMPATAAYVAKKIALPNYSLERLIEPDVNLLIGHSYLAMVMGDLDNLPILATAAYNAGPGRAKNWRASLNNTTEGAIFAETIPFNETRGYVKHVFANAVLYGVVTGNKPKLVSQWLGVVAPKAATVTTLP